MTVGETIFAFTDTETTRQDPADPEQEVIEVATSVWDGAGVFQREFVSLVFAQHPIPAASSGIHHLTDGDLIGQPSREQIDEQLLTLVTECASLPVPVAHNAPFDKAVLGNERNGLHAMEWLCTERMAHHLIPDAPNFKLGTLFYHLGGRTPILPGTTSHRAAFDVVMLVFVFFKLLATYRDYVRTKVAGDEARIAKSEQIEIFLEFFRRPYVMTHWPNFGKHARAPLASIPLDYFEWCLSPRGLTDMDADLRFNIERQMRRGTLLEGA